MRQEMIEALKNQKVVEAMREGISDAIIKAFKDAGVECTKEDVDDFFQMNVDMEEMDEEELENVAGGLKNSCGTGAAIACTIFIISAAAAFV